MQISIQQLNKTYRGGVHALNDLDLNIPNGMFGLLGPNGAGKTTLMRILAGILHPTSGVLYVGEHDGTTEHGRSEIKKLLGSGRWDGGEEGKGDFTKGAGLNEEQVFSIANFMRMASLVAAEIVYTLDPVVR